MQWGSQEHKELFCRSFLDSYRDYQPETLPWPDLESEDLAKLKAIPFWRQAFLTEQSAGLMVSEFAKTIEDPLIKEAIALQGQEEKRHGRLIAYLIDHYGIEIEPVPPPTVPPNLQESFLDFGYEECLDSYFAFGMFGIARQAQYLPEPIFTIFDPILDEEARHIVFFINWVTYLQIQKGYGLGVFRGVSALWHYSKALWKLASIFGDTNQEDELAFVATGANTFMDNLTPELFLSTCLAENAQRMSKFDPQLLRPQLMPRLSQLAWRSLNLFSRTPSLSNPSPS